MITNSKQLVAAALRGQPGADVLELDHAVDIGEACRAVGSEIALWGNLDPVRVLSQGTPDQVRSEARQVLAAVEAAGHRRFVLSSGCTLAMETPAESLEALMAACRERANAS
jgi:uroporphyrinogen-III decarboxylase